MGKAFRRLEKQVGERRQSRTRWMPPQLRIAELEKALLEVYAYLALNVATDPEDASDAALIEAYHDFKKHLEGII